MFYIARSVKIQCLVALITYPRAVHYININAVVLSKEMYFFYIHLSVCHYHKTRITIPQ
jgi:hypothetical protein